MFYDITVDFGGVNYPKPMKQDDILYIGFVSVFSGCNRAMMGHPCPDCQNPSLWQPVCRPKFQDLDAVSAYIRKKVDLFDQVSANKTVQYFYAILGGEPLDQDVLALKIVHKIVRDSIPHEIRSIMFTGYPSLDHALIGSDIRRYVEEQIDYLKVGAFLGNDHKIEDLESGLSTPNQYWIDLSNR